MTHRPRVLVLCTGNRCRSQMAEGWLRQLGGDRLEVRSAGVTPKGVHPLAVQVMAEVDVDISAQRSEPISQYLGESFDYVVTVCDPAREACPTFPGARQMIHRTFDDPDAATGSEEEVLAVFRRVRDEIGAWARRFVDHLFE